MFRPLNVKAFGYVFGVILLLGGSIGAYSPKEWTYQPSGRLGVGPAVSRTVSKEGAQFLAFAAIVLGVSALYFTYRLSTGDLSPAKDDPPESESM